MFKALFVPLQLSISIFACLFATPLVAQQRDLTWRENLAVTLAQVTSDGTVNTQVNTNGNVAEITGGETREGNLFHSFEDFSVPTNNEAFFNNADQISNIFSRVTGGNISNIDGLIRANGSASLFLINPAGIIFGENASLNLGGSFYGSTASSILFDGGEFSAVNNLEQPILTVNAPIGLSFRDNPGEIINRSLVEDNTGETIGLEVNQGNTLALIGGELNFEAGQTTARGGNIYLGGLAEAGIVSVNQDGSLSFPQDLALADVSLTNAANADVRGTGGGSITIDAQNLTLEAGDGSSFIGSGIGSESTNPEAQAGNVTVNVAENIKLDNSFIINQVDPESIGNSGNIAINTGSLDLDNGSQVATTTAGQGNAGAINITATGDITADGENPDGFSSGITSQVNPDAVGNAGEIKISTSNLDLTNGGQVDASTGGQGNAGAVRVTATGDITADGENSASFPSSITSQADLNALGDAGGITISTSNLDLTNGGLVDASTFGQGNAGALDINATGDIVADGENSTGFPSGITSQTTPNAVGNAGGIIISTSSLNLTNGGRVDASTGGQGNAGAIDINATKDIVADGEDSDGSLSGITSQVRPNAVGNAGGITISTFSLNLTNGGQVDASTGGRGDAGAINITAAGNIVADGEDSDGFQSSISSIVDPDAVGDAAGVTISTSNLTLTNGGRVSASTGGRGDAGAVSVTATGDITADGENLDGLFSGITSQVDSDAEGNSGGITISTSNLNLTNGGKVEASIFGRGNAGAINITATGDTTADGEDSRGFASGITSGVNTNAEGDAAGVTILTSNLNLTDGGRIAASTLGQGDAGAINITATEDITVDGEDSNGFFSVIASGVDINAIGDAEGITISTSNLNLTNGGRVDARTGGQGNAGVIDITATGDITVDGENSNASSSGITSGVVTNAEGNSGGITISTSNLNLTDGGIVDASTFGQGNASDIDITASESISINGFAEFSRSGISANAFNEDGNGGNVSLNTGSLTIANGGTIEATNFDNIGNDDLPGTGRPGSIDIVANSIELDDSARIEAATQFTDGVSGIINLQVTEDIILKNNSFISAQAFGNADGGNLTIDARYVIAFDSNGTGNDLIATAKEGVGGNIEFNVDQLFGLESRDAVDENNDFLSNDTNDLDVSGIVDGDITINTLDFNPLRVAAELPTNIIDAQQTTQQACQANREQIASGGLVISGKGGIPPEPSLPLSSSDIYVNGESNYTKAIPAPIATAQGKIQPARGVKVTKSGEITLTAYRTNNVGERVPQIEQECG